MDRVRATDVDRERMERINAARRFLTGEALPVDAASKPQAEALPIASLSPTDAELREAKARVKEERAIASAAAERAMRAAITDLLYRDQNGDGFLWAQVGSRREVLHLNGEAARDWLGQLIERQIGRFPGRDVLDRNLASLRASRSSALEVRTFNRVGTHGGCPVLDLNDSDGRAVFISSTGCSVQSADAVAFVRTRGGGVLPVPQFPSSPTEAWAVLADWLSDAGVSEGVRPAIVVAIVEMLRVDTPHPMIEIVGPAGSGKTTLARLISGVVDPTSGAHRPEVEIDEANVAALLANRYIVAADNRSGLNADAQDLLCRVSTGGELAARRLYAQGELFSVAVRNPVVVTAINPVLTRQDAASRAVRVTMSDRANYASESDVLDGFHRSHPLILGAVCTLCSVGLAGLSAVKSQRYSHRLADFEMFGEAIYQATGRSAGDFSATLQRMRRRNAHAYLVGDALGRAIMDEVAALLGEPVNTPSANWDIKSRGGAGWHRSSKLTLLITPWCLLDRLHRALVGASWNELPRDGRALVGAVRRLTPTFKDVGFNVRDFDASPGAKRARLEFELTR